MRENQLICPQLTFYYEHSIVKFSAVKQKNKANTYLSGFNGPVHNAGQWSGNLGQRLFMQTQTF